MSLKVWLPLDGDLHNQGCSDIEVTNNGATVDNNGKIGKCYYFDGNAHYLQLSKSVGDLYSGDFSWAVWLKPTDSTRSIISSEYSSAGSSNVAFELSASRGVRIYWNGSPDIYPSNSTLPIDTWTHVAITKTTGIIKTYLNGVLRHTYTGTLSNRPSTSYIRIGDDYRGGTSVSYMGYMNDWRLYDHCLSAAEVHEIAMGLVLHYKLDANSEEKITTIPSTNVYSYPTFNTSATGGGWYHWGPSGHSGNYGQNTDKKYIYNKNNTYSHWITEDIGAGKYYLLYQSPAFEGGYRSLQAIIKEENSLPITESICCPSWNARNGGVPNNKWTSIKDLGDGFYYCCCEGVSQDGSNDLIGIDVKPGYKIYVSECYLENNTEKCSPIFSYSSNIIQDSSGYGHNGTITGNITTSFSTPRYNISTNFPDSACAIAIGNLAAMIPEGIFTFNIWFKKVTDEWSSKPYETILGGPSGFELEGKNGSTNSPVIRAYSWGGSTFSYTLDEWHMLTMIRTTTDTKFYLDGKLKLVGSAGSIPSGDYFIGAWKTATQQNYRGYLSDVRIYCTPLLDTDIKLLYNVGMRVDNLQNLHTFEYKENTSNLFRSELIMPFAKTGYTEGNGNITIRNGSPAMDIRAHIFYQNLENSTSGFLKGYFKANTSYVFDIWIDTDAVIYNGNNVAGGLAIIYTDGTSENTFVFTGGDKGWRHKIYITPNNKTIDRISVYYYVGQPVYCRLDSCICPLSNLKLHKTGIFEGTNLLEETNTKLIKNALIETNEIIEI